MNVHSLAALHPSQRIEMVRRVEQGYGVSHVARMFRISRETVYKWLGRWKAGDAELQDRSSRPHSSPQRLTEDQQLLIEALRRSRMVISKVASSLGLVRSTVGRYVNRMGLGRLRVLDPPREVQRFEHKAPGDLLHLDVKKLRRFTHPGRKYIDLGGKRQRGASRICLHVCIDDHSRYAFAELLPTEDAKAACGFLSRAVEHFRRLGVEVKAILTDNAMAYRSHAMRKLCQSLNIRQRFIRPYRPQTNGKAERFIRTACQEWADPLYQNSEERDAKLPAWLYGYNHNRPHSALNNDSPASRLPKCQQPVET